jgi:hypothetical protein
VLLGFYQSNQATAAACQVNKRPARTGDLPGLRNWENPEHVAELARLWNVDSATRRTWR